MLRINQITFQKSAEATENPILLIEDGTQFKVELCSKDTHLIAASFSHYLLKNIGVLHYSHQKVTEITFPLTNRWLRNIQ